MKSDRSIFLRILPVAGLLLVIGLGCEEGVAPNLGTERPFTLWGHLNPKTDTHMVRIFEIEPTIRQVSPDPLDARVTSTNLVTGDVVTWQDSVVQLPDGDYRHVYWSTFDPPIDHRYRLDVVRSDGANSFAEATVPDTISLRVDEPISNLTNQAKQPISILGSPPALPRVDVTYIIFNADPVTAVSFGNVIVISYAGEARPSPEGFLLEIDLRRDRQEIINELADRDEPTGIVEVRTMMLDVFVGDEQWVSPTGIFDAEFLVEPGSFSNVENGFGFFGAGYAEHIEFRPSEILLDRAGFTVGPKR